MSYPEASTPRPRQGGTFGRKGLGCRGRRGEEGVRRGVEVDHHPDTLRLAESHPPAEIRSKIQTWHPGKHTKWMGGGVVGSGRINDRCQ